MVNEILADRSKHKFAFIDAEGLASHISVQSETQTAKVDKSKTGTNSSKSNNGKTVSKNVKTSNTNLN